MSLNFHQQKNRWVGLLSPGQCVSYGYNSLNRHLWDITTVSCVVMCLLWDVVCVNRMVESMLNVGPRLPPGCRRTVNGRVTLQTGAVCRRHGNTHPPTL